MPHVVSVHQLQLGSGAMSRSRKEVIVQGSAATSAARSAGFSVSPKRESRPVSRALDTGRLSPASDSALAPSDRASPLLSRMSVRRRHHLSGPVNVPVGQLHDIAVGV